MPTCPFRVLRDAQGVVSVVSRLVRDHRAGVICEWPDGYTGAVSEAVYYVLEQVDAAQEAVEARDAARAARG